jgi:hypothetical protein
MQRPFVAVYYWQWYNIARHMFAYSESVWEQSNKEDIWTYNTASNRGVTNYTV